MSKIDEQQLINSFAESGNFYSEVHDTSKIKHNAVDENYCYLPTNIFFKMFSLFVRFIMLTLGRILLFFVYHPIIKGRENLKNVSGAITVSNHVLILDVLLNRIALRGHKQYVTAESFNNRKGFGGLLKAGGILPFGETYSAQKNLNKIVSHLLKSGCFVHYYSEQTLWKAYEKSRPFKKGAFTVAAKENVPVIPVVICFRKPKVCLFKRKFVNIFISKPIYPDENKTRKENEEHLQTKAQKFYDDTIIDFYNYDKEKYTYLGAPQNTLRRKDD